MKTIMITFEQSEYEELKAIKKAFKLTWKELITEGANELNQNRRSD